MAGALAHSNSEDGDPLGLGSDIRCVEDEIPLICHLIR